MANGQRDVAKEHVWRGAIDRHGASGLSVREFCRREGLKETSFFAWRRTIRERDGPSVAEKPPTFVPVVVSDQPTLESSITIELVSGHVLKLPASISVAWVAELLATLRSGADR